MKKYKIALGTCGGKVISTPVISAADERDAVIKYLLSMNERITEEKIKQYLPGTYEYIPVPREKKAR